MENNNSGSTITINNDDTDLWNINQPLTEGDSDNELGVQNLGLRTVHITSKIMHLYKWKAFVMPDILSNITSYYPYLIFVTLDHKIYWRYPHSGTMFSPMTTINDICSIQFLTSKFPTLYGYIKRNIFLSWWALAVVAPVPIETL